MIIYIIKNTVNNKIYIGQTTRTINERLREHISDAITGRYKTHLHRAIRHYGPDKFISFILDHASSLNELNSLEKYWIKITKSTNKSIGYNRKEGGLNGKHLPETIEKIRKAGRRRICKESTREKLRKNKPPSMKGKHFTEEHKRKMSEAQKGRKKSPEQIEKMRMVITGRKLSDEHKANISLANKGKKKPDGMMKALRLHNIGSKRSEESKRKMSLAKIGYVPWNKGRKGIK